MATSAYVASLLLRRPGEFWPYFDVNLKLAIEFAAALLCLIGAARRGPGRVPGLLLGSALLLWSVGDLLFTVASPEGAPVPSGVFQVDERGRVVTDLPWLDQTSRAKTFAVTLEPAAGTAAPTGPMVLAGNVS
jgi:hypothetical protein